jgi:hypothetical protein
MLLTSQLVTSQEHPDFMIPIFEKHSQLWAKDMEDIQAMCTQKHGTRISEFARDVVAAWKVHPAPTNSFALPPRAADVSNIHEAEGSASKATPETRFWNEAVQIAQEVEKSKDKSIHQKQKPDTTADATSAQTNPYQGASTTPYYDIEPPSFSLFLPGESWSQPLPPTDQVEQANVVTNGVGTSSSGIYHAYTTRILV